MILNQDQTSFLNLGESLQKRFILIKIKNANQLSIILLLLIDKFPLTLSHIWRKAKEGNY